MLSADDAIYKHAGEKQKLILTTNPSADNDMSFSLTNVEPCADWSSVLWL